MVVYAIGEAGDVGDVVGGLVMGNEGEVERGEGARGRGASFAWV